MRAETKMERLHSRRILWPYGPLRVAFSVLAVFSAVGLYFTSARFAESPTLFAVAALILFTVEVSAFEVGLRHLSFSGLFRRDNTSRAASQASEELERLSREVAEIAALILKSNQVAEVWFKSLEYQVQGIGRPVESLERVLSLVEGYHQDVSRKLMSFEQRHEQLNNQLNALAANHEQFNTKVGSLTTEIFELKRAIQSKASESQGPHKTVTLAELRGALSVLNPPLLPPLILGPNEEPLLGVKDELVDPKETVIGNFIVPTQDDETARNLTMRIVQLMLEGLSEKEMAAQLGIHRLAVHYRVLLIRRAFLKASATLSHLSMNESVSLLDNIPTGLQWSEETKKDDPPKVWQKPRK